MLDPGFHGFLTTVRHAEPSFVLSQDDAPLKKSERLLELALRTVRTAVETDVSDIASRFPADMRRYIQTWPGEHYVLLAALVRELRPARIVEIGTAAGASALVMKKFLPHGGKLVTYDIEPWQSVRGSGLRVSDFDEHLEQKVLDLTDAGVGRTEASELSAAELIFIDAAKDGQMERVLIRLLDRVPFRKPPVVVFDDIRLLNMLEIWRQIDRPKLDLTSFGHWSGTGLVEWA